MMKSGTIHAVVADAQGDRPPAEHAPEPWHTEPLQADNGGSIAICNRQQGILAVIPPLNEDDVPDQTTAQRAPGDEANARRIVAAVNACTGLPVQALEEGVVADMLAALREAQEEIEYWHADMLTEEEANHPRGSGWRRVRDRIAAALAKEEAA
ncbi:MAG TPA: hypothetical protein VJ739_11800 [Gemmataceae bacterium]|nr:hypothetical protein [Gemmataceae bacterium]